MPFTFPDAVPVWFIIPVIANEAKIPVPDAGLNPAVISVRFFVPDVFAWLVELPKLILDPVFVDENGFITIPDVLDELTTACPELPPNVTVDELPPTINVVALVSPVVLSVTCELDPTDKTPLP